MANSACENLQIELGDVRAVKEAYDSAVKEGSETGDYTRARALKTELEQAVKQIEQKLDPNEYKLRDSLAKKFGYRFIGKFSPEGLAVAQKSAARSSLLINREGQVKREIKNIKKQPNGFYTIYEKADPSTSIPDGFRILKPDGDYLVTETFDRIDNFSEGLAWVQKRNSVTWSIINENGEIFETQILEFPATTGINSFRDEFRGGLCRVGHSKTSENLNAFYVNDRGETVAETTGKETTRRFLFGDTHSRVAFYQAGDGYGIIKKTPIDPRSKLELSGKTPRFEVINRNGEKVKFSKYREWFSRFENGTACVQDHWTDVVYFINHQDQQVSYEYESVVCFNFYGGAMAGLRDKKWHILKNVAGKIEEVEPPLPVGAYIAPRIHLLLESGHLTFALDEEAGTKYFSFRNGERVLEKIPPDLEIINFSERIYIAQNSDGYCVFLKPNGEKLFDGEFLSAEPFSDGVAKVQESPMTDFYYIDCKGRRIFS